MTGTVVDIGGNGPGAITLRQWTTGSASIAASVMALLVIDTVARGRAWEAGPVVLAIAAASFVWIGSWFLRLHLPRSADFIRHFLPLVFYGGFYLTIHAMITAAHPGTIDVQLAAIDHTLFGVNPVAWLGTHLPPFANDVLYLCYVSYYAGMPVLVVLMWRRAPEKEFRMVLSVMTAAWYGALLSYAAFPALGPQRAMAGEMPALNGILPTTAWIQAFLGANLVPWVRDCVPSMHTGVTILTLAYAWRHERGFFRVYLLPGLGLILATVALQQHYAIDVLLGIAVAILIHACAPRIAMARDRATTAA